LGTALRLLGHRLRQNNLTGKAASPFYGKPTSVLSLGRQQSMDGFPNVFGAVITVRCSLRTLNDAAVV
jgi:hypothetical protein